MSDSITFNFTLTEDDFVEGAHCHALSQRRWWITWSIFFGVWIVPLLAVSIRTGLTADLPYRALPFLAGVASVALMFALAWSWQPRRQARQSPYLDIEMAGTATEDSLTLDNALGRQQSSWDKYVTVLESRDHFLFYPAKNAYAPLPKRAFANPGDLTRFRELIRAKVPGATLFG